MSSETATLRLPTDSGPILRLAKFFLDNRFTMDTAEGLSQWIGCSSQEAAAAAEALVENGILVKRGEYQLTVYALARQAEALSQIARLVGRQ